MTPTWNKEKDESRRALYKDYLEDLGRIGARHETARAFYQSLLTAVWAFVALAGEGGIFLSIKGGVLLLAGIVGLMTCAAWFRQMRSFNVLFRAKKATLRDLEADLLLSPFSAEEKKLTQAKSGHYVSGSMIDALVAVGFALLFVGVLFFKFLA